MPPLPYKWFEQIGALAATNGARGNLAADGMDMVTPPKIPENDGRPPRKRAVALWLIPFAALAVVTALFLQPLRPDARSPEPEPPHRR